MATAKVTQTGYHLEIDMTRAEAEELMRMMQNPITPDESAAASEVRATIFISLRDIGVQ